MSKLLRLLKWSAMGLGALFLLAIIAVAIYTRTDNFNRWLRGEAITLANGSIQGTLGVERLGGSFWSHLTLYNVILRHNESEIANIPRLEVGFSLIPLIWGQLKISSIEAAEPRLNLIQNADGNWNLVQALAPREPEPEKKSTLVVLVRSFRLEHGAIALRTQSSEKVYRLQDLNLQGQAGVRPTGVSLDADLMTVLIAAGQPDLRLKGGFAYEQSAPAPAAIDVKNLWAVSRNSQVKLNGRITTGENMAVKGALSIAKLAPADITYFVPAWPLKPDIAGNLTVEGPLGALNGNLELTGAGGKVAAKFKADLAAQKPRYSATALVRGFDLRQWLGRKDLGGVAQLDLEASGNGYTLRDVQAKAALEVRATQVQDWLLGSLSVQSDLKNGAAAITGRLASQMGGAEWTGKIGLNEKQPTYDLNLSVKDLDPRKVSANNGTSGKLNFRAKVSGAGFAPADMNTRADVRIAPSSIGAVTIKDGVLNIALRNNRVQIARATLAANDGALNVTGELGLDAKNAGKLDYRVNAADIGPWLALVDQKGSGAIDLTGQAKGNLANLHTEGTARLTGLQMAGVKLQSGNIAFALEGSRQQWFPRGVVSAQLNEVAAGIGLHRLNATAKLAQQESPTIQIDLSAQDLAERKHALRGAVALKPEGLTAQLTQLSLAAPDGAWILAGPAMLIRSGETFEIDRLSMKSGAREISLSGRFGFAGKQDLSLTIDRLPLGLVAGFLSQQPKATGLIAAQAHLTGSAAAPEITGTLKLSEATIAGQPYAGASADIGYQNSRASARLGIQQDANHSLSAGGTLPVHLSWNNGFRADIVDGLDFRAQSAGLSIAFLNAFSGKSAENIAGELSLDATARGALKQPDLRGSFQLRDGRMKATPLGIDINGITVVGGLDSRGIRVRELTAKAKDGEIRGSGLLALHDFDASGFRLALRAERWPAIDTQRYQVKVAGDLEAQGTLTAPKLSGKVTIVEGSLRPDVGFLEQNKAPLKPDETIVFVGQDGSRRVPPSQKKKEEAAASKDEGLFKNLTLDLSLRAERNLWIRHPDLVAELSSDLRASKAPNREIDVTGRVDVVRGWLAFQGRRFQLTRGAIQFTGGGKINPSLDIGAQYRLPNYEVDAAIGGTVEKPTLTLTSDPRLEQADILALLLFGKPIDSLSQKEQGTLQQSALSLTSGYVASQIANSVSTALGLDSLGVDISQVDFSGGRIGFGRYIGNKTYVSVSQKLTEDQGRDVSFEYEVAPNWKIGSTTSSTGSRGVDIIWNKRY